MEATIVIPARNEEATIGEVVAAIRGVAPTSQLIVVDNASEDRTARYAKASGASVVSCNTIGLGAAMKRGILEADFERILKTDADIDNWNPNWFVDLLDSKADLARGVYTSPYNKHPMTNYVVRPILKSLFPVAVDVPQPLTGTYAFRKSLFPTQKLREDWSFDIGILIFAMENGFEIENVDIGILSDRERPFDHYIPMAEDISRFLIEHFS